MKSFPLTGSDDGNGPVDDNVFIIHARVHDNECGFRRDVAIRSRSHGTSSNSVTNVTKILNKQFQKNVI